MTSICTKTNMLHACVHTNTHSDVWGFSVLGGTEINVIVRPCTKCFETLGVGLRYVTATWRTSNVRRDRQRTAQRVTRSENVHSYQLTLRKNSDLHTATLKNTLHLLWTKTLTHVKEHWQTAFTNIIKLWLKILTQMKDAEWKYLHASSKQY
jgi:hypothetical protein